MISPRLSDVGLLEFGKAAEAMEVGKKCIEGVLPDIRRRIEMLERN